MLWPRDRRWIGVGLSSLVLLLLTATSSIASWETSFAPQTNEPVGTVYSILARPDAAIVGGDRRFRSNASTSIAVWDGDAWVEIGTASPGTPRVRALADIGGRLHVGSLGGLCATLPSEVEEDCRFGTGRLDESGWTAVGELAPGENCDDDICDPLGTRAVEAFLEFDGALWAGGSFARDLTSPESGTLYGLARWNETESAWERPAGTPSLSNPDFAPAWVTVSSLVEFDGMLVVGGGFEFFAGAWHRSLFGFDGTEPHVLTSSATGLGFVNALLAHGGVLYVGHTFGILIQSAAEFPDGAWTTLGAGVNGTVNAIVPYEDGILVGGAFTEAGGAPANSLAYWNGAEWSEFEGGVRRSNGSRGVVEAIAVVGGDVHVGGSFALAGEVPSENYAIFHGEPPVSIEPVFDPPSADFGARFLGAAPNPFNPSTSIRFELGGVGSATIDVFDTSGRLIRSFDLRGRGTGPSSVRWNGLDRFGTPVASGVYLARLKVGDRHVDATRLVLLK